EDEKDTLRVLVATDCHLGYMEKDEIRRHDSFESFEEICSIAEKKQVDFILLGGDLFHENKPSRSTLVRALEILRQYCLNDRPVQFQVVSDQTLNFSNRFGHVNYEDPHYNVGLPVFTIHGNHDDPAGVDNLSAVDILSACNLVNYFGKMDLGGSGVGQITVCPILIRKGSTSVALYGLGNIRDERLNRMFQTPHAVQWMRPEAQEGCQVSDWFNILVLHQNRIKTNPKNAINEHFLPRFLDFIVWGHEHECLIDPQEVSGMGFHITQPGSSVATSLIDGESKPKHVLLLEIKGNQYRPTKIPLQSVRPFEYAEVVLKDVTDIDQSDQNAILEHLDKVVRDLIEKSNRKAVNKAEVKLPLVRVKVDYSGFMTINPQRFGQKYVGKVANPQDILIFSKASRVKNRSEEIQLVTVPLTQNRSAGENAGVRVRSPTRDANANIPGIKINFGSVQSNLNATVTRAPEVTVPLILEPYTGSDGGNGGQLRNIKGCKYGSWGPGLHSPLQPTSSCVKCIFAKPKMEILPVNDLDIALHNFVSKDDKLAFHACLQHNLDETRERVKHRATHPKETFSFSAPSEEFRGKRMAGTKSAASFSDDDATQLSGLKSTARGKKATTKALGSSHDAAETDLVISYYSSLNCRSSSVAASASVHNIAGDDDNVDSALSDEAEEYVVQEVADSSGDDEKLQGKGRKRAAPRGGGRGSTQPSKRGKQSGSSSLQKMLMGKDDDDDIPNRFNKSQPKVRMLYD
uniref:Double-strand break repair protein n=1 Tax=Chenopodium quinoa TaxID=63459 RepID=A0A803MH54_CHEQI